MSSKQWLAVAAWVFLPLAASAQQKHPESNPLDPDAPVSAIRYESAFKNIRASTDESESPDKVWRAANEQMGKLAGHAGHMKDSDSQPVASPAATDAPPKQGGTAEHARHH
jgi:hypothetical protein